MSYKISFLITTRNESQSVLSTTIDGLLETSTQQSREIIVIDDGSDIPVACTWPEVLVIRNARTIGVSQSRRYAASIASGDVLVWLDAHMTFAPDWLDRMLNYVDSGALLCSAFWDYEQSTCHCWGADFLWCGERNYQEGRYPGFQLRHRTKFPGNGAVEVPMVVGACYMTLRQSYEQFGGCSPLFRVYGIDEQDISARAWITGCGVKCVTRAKVGHMSRSTFPYPVHFEHLEFNQLAMVQTIFEEQTVQVLEQYFKPFPKVVKKWLNQTDSSWFRQVVQSRRHMSDEEFFRRFAPEVPLAEPRGLYDGRRQKLQLQHEVQDNLSDSQDDINDLRNDIADMRIALKNMKIAVFIVVPAVAAIATLINAIVTVWS